MRGLTPHTPFAGLAWRGAAVAPAVCPPGSPNPLGAARPHRGSQQKGRCSPARPLSLPLCSVRAQLQGECFTLHQSSALFLHMSFINEYVSLLHPRCSRSGDPVPPAGDGGRGSVAPRRAGLAGASPLAPSDGATSPRSQPRRSRSHQMEQLPFQCCRAAKPHPPDPHKLPHGRPGSSRLRSQDVNLEYESQSRESRAEALPLIWSFALLFGGSIAFQTFRSLRRCFFLTLQQRLGAGEWCFFSRLPLFT